MSADDVAGERAEQSMQGSVMAWLRLQRDVDPVAFDRMPTDVLLDRDADDEVKRRFLLRHAQVAAEQ